MKNRFLIAALLPLALVLAMVFLQQSAAFAGTPPQPKLGKYSPELAVVAEVQARDPMTGTRATSVALSATLPFTDPITVTQPLTAPVFLPVLLTDISWHLPFIMTPAVFAQPHPANGAQRSSVNVWLEWEFDDSALKDAKFNIFLEAGDDTPDEGIAWDLTRRALDPFTFEADTVYYWRVEAYDPNGKIVRGPVWTFSTDYLTDAPELGTMLLVPEGEFLMGCDPSNTWYGCQVNEIPLHPVYLDSYYVDKYETTNKEYRACVEAGACYPPRKYGTHKDDPYFDNPEFDYYPVLFVANRDAKMYCEWAGKRLLTEAEWEKAARGPIDTRPWPWGSEPWDCTRMNRCRGEDGTNPARVDSFLPGQSPYGALHMAGNTHEFVQDFYQDYFYYDSPYYNPVNLESQREPYYSARGGGYHDNWWYARTSHRNAGHHGDDGGSNDSPLFRSFRVGIRCGASVEPAE